MQAVDPLPSESRSFYVQRKDDQKVGRSELIAALSSCHCWAGMRAAY